MAGLVNFQKTWYNWLPGCNLIESRWHYTPETRNWITRRHTLPPQKMTKQNRLFHFSNPPLLLTTLLRLQFENMACYTGSNVLIQSAQCKHSSIPLVRR